MIKKIVIIPLIAASLLGAAVFQSTPTAKNSRFSEAPAKVQTVVHYDGENANSIGTGGVATLQPAIRLTPIELNSHYGKQIKKVQLYIYGREYNSVMLKIYEGASSTEPGTLLSSQDLTVIPDSLAEYTLDTPITLFPGKDYWIGYEITATGGNPAGCDAGPVTAPGKSNMIKFNGSWTQISVLSPFSINWNIRAVVDWADGQDTSAPVITTPSGTLVTPGSAMTVSATVSDATGIAEVTGFYKLAGQTGWSGFTMSADKVSGSYSGTIPAQAAAVSGKLKIKATDTAVPANSGESAEFDIAWSSEAAGVWIGNVDALLTGSLGLTQQAWKAGMVLNLGTGRKKISKIAYKCLSGASGMLTWSVLGMINDATWGANVLSAGGSFANMAAGDVWQEVIVSDTTALSGTVGFNFDFPNGGFFGRHAEGTVGNSYVFYDNNWSKLGQGPVANFKGDWALKLYVTGTVDIPEEAEVIPGTSELDQNYPNPFNPTTAISFNNNMSGMVKLTVLNIKGETVATLINRNLTAGSYQTSFDGSNLNSGVYFYKLQTPTAELTRKMVLCK